MEASQPIVECRNVTHHFGAGHTRRTVLSDVNCVVPAGRMVALMGPSGSGKSTLLNILGGLERPSSGQVSVGGVSVEAMSPAEATSFRGTHIGFVFQEWNLIRDLTVVENVMLPLRLRGCPRREAETRAKETLARVGIGDLAGKFPDACSGGEQQRASIARAIVDGRPLLLADEPTGALDAENGARVLDLMRQAAGDGDRAVVVATHDPAVAQACDEVWQIRDGRLVTPPAGGGLA